MTSVGFALMQKPTEDLVYSTEYLRKLLEFNGHYSAADGVHDALLELLVAEYYIHKHGLEKYQEQMQKHRGETQDKPRVDSKRLFGAQFGP